MALILVYVLILFSGMTFNSSLAYDITSIRISTSKSFEIKIYSTIPIPGYHYTADLVKSAESTATDTPTKWDSKQKFSISFQNVNGKCRLDLTVLNSITQKSMFSLSFSVTANQNPPPPPTDLIILSRTSSSVYLTWKSDSKLNIAQFILCYWSKSSTPLVCARISSKQQYYNAIGLESGKAFTFFIAQENSSGTSSFVGKLTGRTFSTDSAVKSFHQQIAMNIEPKFNGLKVSWNQLKNYHFVESYLTVQMVDTALTSPVLEYCSKFYRFQLFHLLSDDKLHSANESMIKGICGQDVAQYSMYFRGSRSKFELNLESLKSNQKYRISMIHIFSDLTLWLSKMVSTKQLECWFDCWDTSNKLYLGKQSMTKQGLVCQNWHSNSPHYPNSLIRNSLRSGANNYCRMPPFDPDKLPWCFTTSSGTVWDYCDMPSCKDLKSQPICPLKFQFDASNKALKVQWTRGNNLKSSDIPNLYLLTVEQMSSTKKCVLLIAFVCKDCTQPKIIGSSTFQSWVSDCGGHSKRESFQRSQTIFNYTAVLDLEPGSSYNLSLKVSNHYGNGIRAIINEIVTVPNYVSGPPRNFLYVNRNGSKAVTWSSPLIDLGVFGYIVVVFDNSNRCSSAFHWSCSDCSNKDIRPAHQMSYKSDYLSIIRGCPLSKIDFKDSEKHFVQNLDTIILHDEFELIIFPINYHGFGMDVRYGRNVTIKLQRVMVEPESSNSAVVWITIVLIAVFCILVALVYKKKATILNMSSEFNSRMTLRGLIHKSEKGDETNGEEPSEMCLASLKKKLSKGIAEEQLKAEFKLMEELAKNRETTLKLTTTTALLPENVGKNRYKSIVPFDHNVVQLSTTSNHAAQSSRENGYINASLINGKEHQKTFIASQGPIQNTINDFWQMIWTNDISIIVSLSKTDAEERFKCEPYWPEPDRKKLFIFNDEETRMEVSTEQIFDFNSFIIREMQMKSENTMKIVKQFHLLIWDNHQTPEQEEFFKFWRNVNTAYYNLQASSPILVHCSAGVGRTGTFITIDNLIEDLNAGSKTVDIFHTILKLREQRRKLVQKDIQYEFIHGFLIFLNDTGELDSIMRASKEYNQQNIQSTSNNADNEIYYE